MLDTKWRILVVSMVAVLVHVVPAQADLRSGHWYVDPFFSMDGQAIYPNGSFGTFSGTAPTHPHPAVIGSGGLFGGRVVHYGPPSHATHAPLDYAQPILTPHDTELDTVPHLQHHLPDQYHSGEGTWHTQPPGQMRHSHPAHGTPHHFEHQGTPHLSAEDAREPATAPEAHPPAPIDDANAEAGGQAPGQPQADGGRDRAPQTADQPPHHAPAGPAVVGGRVVDGTSPSVPYTAPGLRRRTWNSTGRTSSAMSPAGPSTATLCLHVPQGAEIQINGVKTRGRELAGVHRGKRYYHLTGLSAARSNLFVVVVQYAGRELKKTFHVEPGEYKSSGFPADEVQPQP